MDTDLYFVIGLVILAFSIPAMLSAFSDGRPPRAAAILLLIGGGLVAYAVHERPDAYTVAAIPDAFVRVVARILD